MNSFKTVYVWISKHLKERRTALKLTQQEVAARTELTRTSLANIEAGRQHPPLHIIYQLCEVLDIEPSDMLPPKRMLEKVRTLRFSSDQEEVLPARAAEVLEGLLQEVEE